MKKIKVGIIGQGRSGRNIHRHLFECCSELQKRFDVVAVADDACDEWVVDVVAHRIAVYALHCGCPQLHVVFLLVVESLRHTIRKQQRYGNKDGGEYQNDHSSILQNLIFQSQ